MSPLPANDEPKGDEIDDDEFIAFSSTPISDELDYAHLLKAVVEALDPSASQLQPIYRQLRLPVPSLSKYDVSAAVQIVKAKLEETTHDPFVWILYLKLFLALGVDLRIFRWSQ